MSGVQNVPRVRYPKVGDRVQLRSSPLELHGGVVVATDSNAVTLEIGGAHVTFFWRHVSQFTIYG